jgi:radical SAM superfamily enzyme YgiQ (UPF0313 family)
MQKQVLLINPNIDSHYVVPPVNLGFLATALRKSKFDVDIIDGIKDRLDAEDLKDRIISSKPDVIGFSVYSCNVSIVKKYIAAVRSIFPDILIVVGGPHVSGVKENIFRDFEDIDYAFVGEAEISFPKFLVGYFNNDLNKKDIAGLVWRDKNTVSINDAYFEENLDRFGFPAWDLIDPRTYPTAPQGAVFRNYPIGPIITARGCPFQCTYCASTVTVGRRLRARSIDSVIEEIRLLYDKYGVREIHIIDDTFTSLKTRVIEFCNKLLDSGMKITLTFPNGVRLNTLDEEVLRLLKKAGCYAFSVGIESGSEKILKDMKKNLTLDIIREKTALIKKVGIDMNGFFIIGYPTENRETILETIKFAKELPLKRAHFSVFLPLPGTESTNLLIEQGRLKDGVDWDKLTYVDVPCPPEGMGVEDIKSLQRKAFLEFYMRPKIMFYLASEIRNVTHFKYLMKRSIDYAFNKK